MCMCITYTESVLSKFDAPGCAPAGAFSHQKIYFLYLVNRECLFLCPPCTKYVLSKLGASGCAPAGAFCPPARNTFSILPMCDLPGEMGPDMDLIRKRENRRNSKMVGGRVVDRPKNHQKEGIMRL